MQENECIQVFIYHCHKFQFYIILYCLSKIIQVIHTHYCDFALSNTLSVQSAGKCFGERLVAERFSLAVAEADSEVIITLNKFKKSD